MFPHDEAVGLKSLKNRRDELHLSVSDKGGEFVVMEKSAHKELTVNHLTSTGVYSYVAPTTKYKGNIRPIANPTPVSYSRQRKSMVKNLQDQCNSLWKRICETRHLHKNMVDLYTSRNTQLPTMYILLKTHKFDASSISVDTDITQTCKVRPIVSCCGSPTEKLAWICTQILSPLLKFVPSHLKDTHTHLEQLSSLTQEQLKGLKFCTADVTSLYTNINILGCV